MENEKNNRSTMTRRAFLKLSLWFSGLVSGWGIFQFLSYAPPQEELLSTITLFPPNTILMGSVIYIPEVLAWLVRDEEGISAISATCTHLGCAIRKEPEQFACPCHGSQFDFKGRVLKAPATKRLLHFQVTLSEEGRIVIDRRVIVAPAQKLKVEN